MSLTAIDAGHGGQDPGTIGFGHKEEDYTLAIAKIVDQELAANGIANYLTRVDDVDIKPADRVRKIKNSGARVAVSVHINAGKGTGFDVIYSIHDNPLFAQTMFNELAATGFPSHLSQPYTRKSAKYPGQDYYYIIRDTRPVETLIVECGFIDNMRDLNLIINPAWQRKIGCAIALGVMKYLQALKLWKPAPPPHYAKIHNDELMAGGILLSDHTPTLDQPATEGMVITLVNQLRRSFMLK